MITWLLLAIMVVTTVLGDVLQSHEMKRTGAQKADARGLLALIRIIGQRAYLILAIVCMAVSFFAFMALLQRAPMSFAVPASAATVILETILAKTVLRERVSPQRWTGAFLVAIGVFLLAR
jgi:drug/metabolite transporter (DMT)-like permease